MCCHLFYFVYVNSAEQFVKLIFVITIIKLQTSFVAVLEADMSGKIKSALM